MLLLLENVNKFMDKKIHFENNFEFNKILELENS